MNSIKKRPVWTIRVGIVVLAFTLIGCSQPEPTSEVKTVLPVPTVNSLLIDNSPQQSDSETLQTIPMQSEIGAGSAQPKPTVAVLFDSISDVELVPTATSQPAGSSQAALQLVTLSFGLDSENTRPFTEELIYDDELNQNWTLANSEDVEYDVVNTSRWYEVLDETLGLTSGAMSIAFEPKADFAQLFFTVNEDTEVLYDRDEILGISFWMHTGDEIVDTGDFAVTVVGSNDHSFWSPDDESVFFPGDESFSETALYFLDINRAVPAGNWVKIEVWLDELLYDPNYSYITGIYIKNDAGFRNKVYIDRVALLKLGRS